MADTEPEVWTLAEVDEKAEWEGGLSSLYRWGGAHSFTTSNAEFNELWRQFCTLMDDLSVVSASIDALIERELTRNA